MPPRKTTRPKCNGYAWKNGRMTPCGAPAVRRAPPGANEPHDLWCANHYNSMLDARRQEERALRRAKGLCLLCNTPKLPGYVMCQKHRTIYRPKSAHPAAQRGTR